MKFSIIVPVYNVEKYLDKCLNSIFSNSYSNYEVIIINDGTEDNSEDIINKYLKKYNNIIYIKQKNKGLSSARNQGLKKAKGDYIIFIDSDDYIENDMLSKINQNLKDTPDILRYQLREIFDNKVVDCKEIGFDNLNGIDAFNKIIRYKYIEPAQLYVYKLSYLRENNFMFKEGIYHEDFALIPIVIIKANTVKSISYIGYNYLKREGSIINNTDHDKTIKKMDDCITSFKEAINVLNKIKNSNDVKSFYANSIIDKFNMLSKNDKKIYKSKIKDLKVFDYLQDNTLKRKIKKIIYKIKFEVNL